jgi:hypothetical protein
MTTSIPAGYPPDYVVMLRDLLLACKDKRIRASSTHSIYSQPGYRMTGLSQLAVIVSGMEICIRESGVHCFTHQLGTLKVLGSSLGDGGVWLSITAATSRFG